MGEVLKHESAGDSPHKHFSIFLMSKEGPRRIKDVAEKMDFLSQGQIDLYHPR